MGWKKAKTEGGDSGYELKTKSYTLAVIRNQELSNRTVETTTPDDTLTRKERAEYKKKNLLHTVKRTYIFENGKYAGFSKFLRHGYMENPGNTILSLYGLASFRKDFEDAIKGLKDKDSELYERLNGALKESAANANKAYKIINPIRKALEHAEKMGNKKLERKHRNKLFTFINKSLEDCLAPVK